MPARDAPPDSYLLANLLHFAGMLRRMGFSIGTQQVISLASSLPVIDLRRYDDFYTAAECFLVHDPDRRDAFRQAFELFWAGRYTWAAEFGFGKRQAAEQEALDALEPARDAPAPRPSDLDLSADEDEAEESDDTGVSSTYSATERLYQKDFAAFSDEELAAARRAIEALVWRFNARLTRRRVRARKRADTFDVRRALRQSMQQGGEIVRLAWRRRKLKPRPLVIICDISGSMERYSRLLLHFMYAMVQQDGQQIETFVFGTRLTRITPALRTRNVEEAVAEAALAVVDWSGGTRIGQSLRTFNYRWARRVLRRGASVMIISDGWDRGDIGLLEREIARLSRSTSHLLWLNPLLGRDDYEPLVRGIQAVLPHVDAFLPLHNLASLEQLAVRLGKVAVR